MAGWMIKIPLKLQAADFFDSYNYEFRRRANTYVINYIYSSLQVIL